VVFSIRSTGQGKLQLQLCYARESLLFIVCALRLGI
jgi:hypothetical protein